MLTLTGLLALLEPGSLLLIFCAVVIALCYNVLHIWSAPYTAAGNNVLASGASTALLLSLLGTLGVQTNARFGSSVVDTSVLSVVLFFSGVMIFAATLLVFGLALRKRAPPASTTLPLEIPVQ